MADPSPSTPDSGGSTPPAGGDHAPSASPAAPAGGTAGAQPTSTQPTAPAGAPSGAPTDPKGPGSSGGQQPPAGDGLGEAGKKALQAEREARKAAEKQAKDLQAELDKIREAQMSDHERAVAEARRIGETETTTKFLRRLFASEAKVAAAGKLANPNLLSDPDVAQRLLGFNEIPVNEAGDIDAEAISVAIDKLTEREPYLKAGQAHATWPSNGSEAGPRGDAKSQLTRDDLKRMKPEEISKARAEGRLDQLLGKT